MVQIPASSARTSQNLNRVWAGLMYQVGQLDFTCDLLLGGCYKRIQWPRGRDSSVITVFMGRPAYFFPATKACRKANHSFYGQPKQLPCCLLNTRGQRSEWNPCWVSDFLCLQCSRATSTNGDPCSSSAYYMDLQLAQESHRYGAFILALLQAGPM